MTITAIHRLAIRYHDELNALGYSPKRHVGDVSCQGEAAMFSHAMWLCNDLSKYSPDPTSLEQEVSAERCLVRIQSLLWAGGLHTWNDLKAHREP
jgi:hypothetical protein